MTYDYNEELESLGMLKALTVTTMNSIAYRGYFYDSETGFYYLRSRYYDPETDKTYRLMQTKNCISLISFQI